MLLKVQTLFETLTRIYVYMYIYIYRWLLMSTPLEPKPTLTRYSSPTIWGGWEGGRGGDWSELHSTQFASQQSLFHVSADQAR